MDPLLIKPSLPVPDDFEAFWRAQKQKLAAVPLKAHLTPVTSPSPWMASTEAFQTNSIFSLSKARCCMIFDALSESRR